MEYSVSTSIAAYQCFCTAPLSPPRRAMAVCSAAAHSASRRCRFAPATEATSAARRPADRPASGPSRAAVGAGGRRSPRRRRCPDGPADDAAGAHRVAAVQRHQRDQRGRGVGGDDGRGLLRHRLGQPGDRRRVAAVERQQQPLGEAAGGAGGRRRRARGVDAQRGAGRRDVADAERRTTAAAPDDGIGVRAEPAEQFGGLRGAAVVHGDAGRDAHRGGPLGGVLGAEQLVGEAARRRAVAGQRQRVGEFGVELAWPRPRWRRGTAGRPARGGPGCGRRDR